MSEQRTRASVSHSIFGNPLEDLPISELPTRLQVARHVLFLKQRRNASNIGVIPQVSESVIELWKRVSIPCQSNKNVKTKLQRLMQEGSKTSKETKLSEKSKNFVQSLNQLFDIAGCQCKDLQACTCDRHTKVPMREREFLTDQRTTRNMQIGSIDRKVTGMLKKRKGRADRLLEREDQEKKRKIENRLLLASQETTSLEHVNFSYSDEGDRDSFDTDVSSGSSDQNSDYNDWETCSRQENRNVTAIPTIALEADRFGVSNRAAAAISTATLVDYGMISSIDSTNVIDHHKVWRARQKLRQDMKKAAVITSEKICALFFDGRKDKTLVKKKIDGRWYSTNEVEDHYVLVSEPGALYLSHITVEAGTANVISDGLHSVLEEMEVTNNIMAIGADSTAVNTGHQGGAIRRLECRLNHPLHWFICYLHLNELPFRHLCKQLIGQTEGPSNWKGPIGKALATCETMAASATGFKSISDCDPLPEIDVGDLSRDQAYLYRIITAIRTGVISADLLRQKPGVMSMARWVTTASRICRLYVATEEPSHELFQLTHFIVSNYGPMWFRIKLHSNCVNGPQHLLQQIKLQKLHTPAIRDITWRIIQRNAYWAHQENVLLAMLADDDQETRKSAVCIIQRIRQNRVSTTSKQQVREFRPPQIKESAITLQDLLPPVIECICEPPLTMLLSNEELEKIIDERFTVDIPCHSQAVERCVKMVTEASKSVYGMDARDGYIRAVIKSRHFMPSFQSKKDFCASTDG